MISVTDVAKYFLSLADEEAGDLISNLKLQKLVYYAQGFYLAVHGKPLFQEEIRAWTHGPVVPHLYHAYKSFGANGIPRPTGFDPKMLPDDVTELLSEVYEAYGQFSAWKLRNTTHAEPPWADAYRSAPDSVISCEEMRAYFITQVQ